MADRISVIESCALLNKIVVFRSAKAAVGSFGLFAERKATLAMSDGCKIVVCGDFDGLAVEYQRTIVEITEFSNLVEQIVNVAESHGTIRLAVVIVNQVINPLRI